MSLICPHGPTKCRWCKMEIVTCHPVWLPVCSSFFRLLHFSSGHSHTFFFQSIIFSLRPDQMSLDYRFKYVFCRTQPVMKCFSCSICKDLAGLGSVLLKPTYFISKTTSGGRNLVFSFFHCFKTIFDIIHLKTREISLYLNFSSEACEGMEKAPLCIRIF